MTVFIDFNSLGLSYLLRSYFKFSTLEFLQMHVIAFI